MILRTQLFKLKYYASQMALFFSCTFCTDTKSRPRGVGHYIGQGPISPNAHLLWWNLSCVFCSMKRMAHGQNRKETCNNTQLNNNPIFQFTSVSNLILPFILLFPLANLWGTQKISFLSWVRSPWFYTFLIIKKNKTKPCSHESNAEVRE